MTPSDLLTLVRSIQPFDELEARHQQDTTAWIKSGAPLYRIQKPDIPPKHLVSYFVIIDPQTNEFLLQDHLLAHLWLPAGGHVDPNEDPAEAVRRECKEELGFEAIFLGEPTPHFITIATTNGQNEHTDVSLWYVLQASKATPLVIEPDKFADVRWWGMEEILETSITVFDPNFHRFIAKIKRSLLA